MSLKATLRSVASLAIGAFLGVVENFVVAAHMNIAQVDWHQAFLLGAGTALVAVIAHWVKPPNA